MFFRLLLIGLFFGLIPSAARGPLDREPTMAAVRFLQGPGDALADLDSELIGRSRQAIDMAAYVLTDRNITDALEAAAGRGVRVRLYLDPEEAGRRGDRYDPRLERLLRNPKVVARFKSPSRDSMHLKAYHVDGRWLRTGSANFSFTGAHRQDNDVMVVENRDIVTAFIGRFEQMWARADNELFHP
jgi:phosphatidylserine/phosphatidylglycerophosphate/cardiolipin synthase-like enzyme